MLSVIKTQLKVAFGFSCLLLFTACKHRSDQALLDSLDKTIAQSTLRASQEMETKLASLQEKLLHPCSAERAKQWLPIARRVQELTVQLTDYFVRQRKALGSGNDSHDAKGLVDSVHHRVQVYRDAILSLHENIYHEFAASLEGLSTPEETPSAISEQLQLLQNANEHQLPVLLTQLRHSIMQLGAHVVIFCGAHVGCFIDRFDTYSAIIGQSNQGVLPGDSVEIFAGIGAFSKAAQPVITIDDKIYPVGEDGVVKYKLAVGLRPGKFNARVKIEYLNEDGIKQWIDREVEWEVLNRK